jgi:hypothetical protein
MVHVQQLENALGIDYKHLASQLSHPLGAYTTIAFFLLMVPLPA